MNQVHTSKIIAVPDTMLGFEQACGAVSLACTGKLHVAMKGGKSGKEIDGKAYFVKVVPVDAEGNEIALGFDTRFVRFEITCDNGAPQAMAELEECITKQLQEIQEKDLDYCLPREFDVVLETE
jgi:hypothetical protein